MRETLRETRLAALYRSARFHWLRWRGRPVPLTLVLDVHFDLLVRGVRLLHQHGAHEYEPDVASIANDWMDVAERAYREGDYETIRRASLRTLEQVEAIMLRAGVDVTRSGW